MATIQLMTTKILQTLPSIKTPKNTTLTKQTPKNGPKPHFNKTGKILRLLMSTTVAIRNSRNPNEERTFMPT